MKVAILTDSLVAKGGEEKQVLLMAKHYNADIYTYYVTNRTYNEFKKFNIFQAKSPVKSRFLRNLFATRYFKNFTIKNLKDKYDVFLVNGYTAVFACKNLHPNFWYSFGPSDLLIGLGRDTLFKKVSFPIFSKLLEDFHKVVIKNVDASAVVSEYTRNNFNKFYRKDTSVINPPFGDVNKFSYNEPEDYYLTVSRLESIKRVDIIIEAFKSMPNKKIVIVGDGTQRKHLERLSKGYKNIKFTGSVDDKTLRKLYSKCIAFIAIPAFDQFPTSPIQALASGKPCIVANEGGLPELINNRKIGIVIKPTASQIVDAINKLNKNEAIKVHRFCRKRAEQFDTRIFFQKLDKALLTVINNGK